MEDPRLCIANLRIRNSSETTPMIDMRSSKTHAVILSHSSSLIRSPSCLFRFVQSLTAASAVVLASVNLSPTSTAAASTNLFADAAAVVREVDFAAPDGNGLAGSRS